MKLLKSKVILILFSTLLVLSLGIVPILASCSSGKTIQETTKESVSETTAAETTKAAETTTTETASTEKIKIDFADWCFGLKGPFQDHWESMVAEYEKEHPNIDINGYNVNYAEYFDKMQTMIAGGTPPDVMEMNPQYFAQFIQASVLVPLDDVIDISKATEGFSDLQKKLIPSIAPDEKTYGIITWSNWFLPWYRPSVLKAAGVDTFPVNLEEFEEMLKKVSKGGNFGLAEAMISGNFNEGQYVLIWWLYALGGDFVDANGVVSLNNDKVIETVEMIKKWYDSGYLPKDIDMSEKRKLMATGKAGVIIGNPNEYSIAIGLNKDLLKEDFLSVKWPTPTQNPVAVITQQMGVSKDSKHPKEAAEFVAWWHNKDNMWKLSMGTGSMIPRPDILNDPEFQNQFKQLNPNVATFLEYSDNLKLFTPAPLLKKNANEVIKTWWTYFEKVIYENMDPKAAMDAAQADALKIE